MPDPAPPVYGENSICICDDQQASHETSGPEAHKPRAVERNLTPLVAPTILQPLLVQKIKSGEVVSLSLASVDAGLDLGLKLGTIYANFWTMPSKFIYGLIPIGLVLAG